MKKPVSGNRYLIVYTDLMYATHGVTVRTPSIDVGTIELNGCLLLRGDRCRMTAAQAKSAKIVHNDDVLNIPFNLYRKERPSLRRWHTR